MKVDKTDFQIDLDNLELELEDQASLRFEYGAGLADVKRDLDYAEAKLDVVEAEAAKSIRSEPGDYGLLKVTENAVKETVPLQPDVQDAKDRLFQARHAVEIFKAAVSAVDHRKSNLGDEVSLWLGNYFSTPRVKGDAGKRMEEAGKRSARKKGVRKRDQ